MLDMSCCDERMIILGWDFEEHIADLKDDNSEEVLVGCETEIRVHASDFRIPDGSAVL
jgi:hypothetical protein